MSYLADSAVESGPKKERENSMFQIVRVFGQDGVGGGRSVRLCQV